MATSRRPSREEEEGPIECMYDNVRSILFLKNENYPTREIIDYLKSDIADRSLRDSLCVDGFPLSFQKYEILTSGFKLDMDWNKALLLFKMGLFVDLNERKQVVDHIVENYCEWIRQRGGLGRLVPKSYRSARLRAEMYGTSDRRQSDADTGFMTRMKRRFSITR